MANVVEEAKSDIAATPVRGAPGAPRKSPAVKYVVLFLLLAGVAAAAVASYLHFKDRVSTDDATVDGHVTAIAPKISGNVIEVAVLDNQPVKTGDVLVRIDPRDFQAKVDQAKAAVLEAESRLRSAQVMVPMTNETTLSGTTAADAQLADAQAELSAGADRLREGLRGGSGLCGGQCALQTGQQRARPGGPGPHENPRR